MLRALEGFKQLQTFLFNRKKKVGETGPIAKPSEMSNMYALKSGQEKFGIGTSQGTISFWVLRKERGNAQIRLQEGIFKKLNKDVHMGNYIQGFFRKDKQTKFPKGFPIGISYKEF